MSLWSRVYRRLPTVQREMRRWGYKRYRFDCEDGIQATRVVTVSDLAHLQSAAREGYDYHPRARRIELNALYRDGNPWLIFALIELPEDRAG